MRSRTLDDLLRRNCVLQFLVAALLGTLLGATARIVHDTWRGESKSHRCYVLRRQGDHRQAEEMGCGRGR